MIGALGIGTKLEKLRNSRTGNSKCRQCSILSFAIIQVQIFLQSIKTKY